MLHPTRRQALNALASGAIALGGCNSPARGRSPGELIVLVNAEPEHLDPRFPVDALGSTISRLVYAGLLESDPVTFEPRLGLAESVAAINDSTVRVTLRPDCRFHDGSVLTAQDVAATYQALLDPAVNSTVRGMYTRVFRAARAIDARTIEFVLTGPDGTYPSLLQQTIVRALDARRPEIPPVPGRERQFVGSGPMRLRTLARGDWTLERIKPVPGRPRVLRFLTMHDPNTLALRLLHAKADIAEIKPELLPLFHRRPGFTVAHAPSAGFTYLGLRNDHPLLSRVEVRRAIAHAIDRRALLSGKLGRYGVSSTGPLPPSHWAYEPVVARYEYDPARARRLLGVGGLGQRSQARLLLRSTSTRFNLTVAHAIAAMLGTVGIDVEVRPSDLASVLADLRTGRFDLTVMVMPDLSDPWGLAWLFASSSVPTPANPRAGGNRWRYRNAALDEALERGRRAFGQLTRRPYYATAQKILAEDLPVVPLWHADLVYAAGAAVRGLQPRGDAQLGFLLNAEVLK